MKNIKSCRVKKGMLDKWNDEWVDQNPGCSEISGCFGGGWGEGEHLAGA